MEEVNVPGNKADQPLSKAPAANSMVLPSIPVERLVLEQNEASRFAFVDQLTLLLHVVQARDATLLRDCDLEHLIGESEALGSSASCKSSTRSMRRP